jgi:hypothetical protein
LSIHHSDIPPNAPDDTPYTVPAIFDSATSTYVMDSQAIARYLESKYPEPNLDVDSSTIIDMQNAFIKAMPAIRSLWLPKVPRNLLNPRSAEYFHRTRAVQCGMPLDELEKTVTPEEAWEKATPAFEELAAILKREPDGPFVKGKTGEFVSGAKAKMSWLIISGKVSYVDFRIVAILQFMKSVDVEIFEKICSIDPALKDLYDACGEWLARDDH